MAWDPVISRHLHEAFHSGNVDEFRKSLTAHPEYIRDEDGLDFWMSKAATIGRLPIIKALVELGMNVNEPHYQSDETDPFIEPEGAILHAASQGHLEIVRWLLENGAKINYVVQNMPRCWPLVSAATNGHLDVVKLLVEHGADIHATWRGVNAITQAEDFGQFAVRDYLHSLGARTLRETTPPNYSLAHQYLIEQMTEQRGPLVKWHVDIPGDPKITLQLISSNEKCDVQTLFTVGLSDHRLPQGSHNFACTELRCMLPPDWPLTVAALEDPNWNWPVEWLKRLVQQLRIADHWPEEPAIIMNGDPPAPLAPQTQLCGWLCLKSIGESVHSPDYRYIDIHSLFPIYAEELALIRQSGYEELINRFQSHDVPLHIDPHRPNMASDSRVAQDLDPGGAQRLGG